ALAGDRTEAINGVTKRVNDAAKVAISDGHRQHLAGAGHFATGFDASEVTEDDDSNLVLVEVQGEAQRSVGEGHELVSHDTGQPVAVSETVSSVYDGADLGGCGRRRLIARDKVFQ